MATDQGVRAILNTYNIALQRNGSLPLEDWYMSEVTDQPDIPSVANAIASLKEFKTIDGFLADIARSLVANVDWRTSSHPELSPEEQLRQSAYRGSSGYAALTKRALSAVADVPDLVGLPEADIEEALDGEPQ
jgi:hypothetical protein